ncbi:MAG: hypothetical protein KAJ14_09150 [Candidatus Omnitrophica bacterium]|nr:hypothetical protein [Candidatus Omnitrophota bacterium]MCK5493263.1 hypothetical protein [Candidatus Omnitrophota bacterium]
MDEAMVTVLWKHGINAVTAEFSVRLNFPAYVGKKLIFSASIEKKAKKVFYTKAACVDEDGHMIGTGSAKCIKVD